MRAGAGPAVRTPAHEKGCEDGPGSRAILLGLGNPLYGDDGAGIEALRLFETRYRRPPGLDVVDGGTQGIALLGIIEDAPALVIVDAMVGQAEPGTVAELEAAELIGGSGLKLSEHQVDVREVLALAAWRRRLPRRLRLVGVVAGRLDPGVGLSDPVRRALPAVVDAAAAWLRRWGVPVERRGGAGREEGR
ncbi:hydrogenase maturation protease [Carboxydochorda subterranea]|uniref:Hydrogenase maturation protease n=1 Tax=Carboxydichorda subterranea TaxID=3109565 RepID=A0ABZ1BV22_9FIRM|nr:hydrogenase maturation protease [Limnochorda sp. L945t]WRP16521.1 hydrogenase maturation protease [Limnochorda sp. L945t]